MLFNSLPFLLVFLPVVLAVFYALNDYSRARLGFLLLASLFFYGYWDWRSLPLLLGSICLNWLLAEAYFRTDKKLFLSLGVAINLGVLGLFKYLGFFLATVAQIGGWQAPLLNLILPLGISFFTFHHIMYLIDCKKGKAPRYSLRDYSLYIALFPQILAGPLVRYFEIVPQFALPPCRPGRAERFVRGSAFLLFGLTKKVFLADELAKLVDPVFAAATQNLVTEGQAWSAFVAFPFQIYFDFSGYSDMAIGVALMFGFSLPFNFDAPYRAANLSQFWRRWHMTLMRFLRDYVYIPLGGNRVSLMRRCLNLMAAFLLGGLWHGAGWTFIIWGALHGGGLAAGVLWRRYFGPMSRFVSWPLLILFLFITWVFFRAASLTAAFNILQSLTGAGGSGSAKGLLLIAFAAALSLFGPSSQRWIAFLRPKIILAPLAAATAISLFSKINGTPAYEFIYFHF